MFFADCVLPLAVRNGAVGISSETCVECGRERLTATNAPPADTFMAVANSRKSFPFSSLLRTKIGIAKGNRGHLRRSCMCCSVKDPILTRGVTTQVPSPLMGQTTEEASKAMGQYPEKAIQNKAKAGKKWVLADDLLCNHQLGTPSYFHPYQTVTTANFFLSLTIRWPFSLTVGK
jgi:hypothetical protein